MGVNSVRDKIWAELYCSSELRKAAKFLIPHNSLYEDLLSDSIIKVFEQRTDYIELHQAGRLKGYVFRTMERAAYKRPSRENGEWWATYDLWAQQYGLAEGKGSDPIEPPDHETGTAIDVDEIEVTTSTELFGAATELGIQLMRKIDEYDACKDTKPELWEAAQYVKLYYHYGSLAEVARKMGTKKEDVWKYVKRFKDSLKESKMKIAVVTRGKEPQSGMELYRLHYPYFSGLSATHADQFEVSQISYEYLDKQPQGALESDVYVFSRLQHPHLADKVLNEGKKFVLDLDDYWGLHSEHPLRNKEENKRYVSTITGLIPRAHLVTTTSDLLAEKIKEAGGNTAVIKNTIPEDAVQFQGEKYPSSLVRFIYMGGRFHLPDVRLMEEGLKKLYQDPKLVGKYQICLGGYNFQDPDYYDYEKSITSNFFCVRADQDYIDYLKLNTPALDHIGYNKPYRRIWARPVTTYGQGYREGDVALIPLVGGNLFNSCKSELKLIEAGMTRTAAIVSDVDPYAQHLQHEKNCLKVSPQRQDWSSQMRRVLVDEELRKDVADGLYKYVRKEFNHKKETNKLAAALRKL